jgi:predicted nucleic acid-binding Zn ribbon protein
VGYNILIFKRKCVVCGKPVYDGRFWYCSMKCRRILKRRRNKHPKYYYDDETGRWEQLN